MSSPQKRRDMDIMKLLMHDFNVLINDDNADLVVTFNGPKDTLYEGGSLASKYYFTNGISI